ncbi:MAG TPA: LysM domain-containing protein [Conexibacter sp.]|nr:LysM domain-containing protein [Conexibacter sp.]
MALLVALVAVVAVVQSSRPGSSATPPPVTHTVLTRSVHHARSSPRTYAVQPGDTLSVIAAKTHVSLERIQQLNPNVDPQALQTGQRIKLAP